MSNSEFGKDYKELKNKNPHSKVLRGFNGGPTWARTIYLNLWFSIYYETIYHSQSDKLSLLE